MKKLICFFGLCLLIAACGGTQTPSWFLASSQQMDRFEKNFLSSEKTDIAELNFQKTVEEIKKSGDLDRLEKAWLTRMALQIAILKEPNGGDYKKIEAVQSVPENKNFYIFLTGEVIHVDDGLLPKQYRQFCKAMANNDVANVGKAIASMKENPVSQIIAAGLAVRRQLESEAILKVAVETASTNGWKIALLAWLERMISFYEARGDMANAALIRQKINLISD